MSDGLIHEVNNLTTNTLGIDGMRPEEIDSDLPLLGERLGSDSIDALQLVVVMEMECDNSRQQSAPRYSGRSGT